ncbi:5-methylcytosine-specific restriction enzyme subunit McrC [Isoptericola variabilis J7]|uniref:5-methylcytosine restriction system component-like protein n=1 Tax=Isoptericola variabilis (strain 225) TaxID=743718 RepID=F6FRE5_ISOV2|nr:5-methylcytosine restriction system component-like protein [Isoptericola variabilis 225]TWH30496.1 5-methylcytosine-specific restriction enzyme subunit McrC [Isoptericola variabilis J7]
MTRRTVPLPEYGASVPVQLTGADLRVLQTVPRERLLATPTMEPGLFTLRASSWVGTVELDTVRVRVVPKVDDLRNVLGMFASAAGLADWSVRASDYADADVVEGIAELVLRTIDQATRRGLVHGYRSRMERLPVLRGRLLVAELAARPWDPWPAPCAYDDFTADVAENRVLLAAVKAIRGWPLPPEVRRLSADLMSRFEEVSDASDPWTEAESIRESPLNEHYMPALRLAAIVLEGAGVAHGAGDREAVSFLVDMNKLYERWIGAELATRLWPTLQVLEQRSVALSRRPRVSMQPDLLFREGGRNVLVGDVKYKLTGSGLARNEDYYQLLAYATALDLPRGILIYCQADDAPARHLTVVGGEQDLVCYPLDLGGPWKDVGERLDELADVVQHLRVPSYSS